MESITTCEGPGCVIEIDQPRIGRRRCYCSDACKVAARRARCERRRCEFCGADYASENRLKRTCDRRCAGKLYTREHPVTPHLCVVCGKEHVRRGPSGGKFYRTCSDECRQTALGLELRQPATCPICAAEFMATSRQKYCSTPCMWVAENARRGRGGHRTRHTGARRERYDDAYVFERDGWRCHICERKIRKNLKWPHPWSASVDHLIPCGRRDKGPDTIDNVRAAHLRCNLSKGRRAANDQLMLVG